MGDDDATLLVTPEDVLKALKESDEPFLSTGEVADLTEVSRPTVLKRLETLEENGDVRRRMVAGNTPVWYLPAIGTRRISEYTDDDKPATAPDGAPPSAQVSDIRERGIEALERFEEELARESARARTLSELDLKSHFNRLLWATGFLLLTIFLIFVDTFLNVFPPQIFEYLALTFVIALALATWAVGRAINDYRKTNSRVRENISIGPLGDDE